jgi:hypothetical protein
MTRLMRQYTVITGIVLALLLVCVSFARAANLHPERWYQEKWCAGRGELEVVMADGSRCDCLTPGHAVEFDFAKKWAEALGQSLNYARQTGRTGGIVFIGSPIYYLDRHGTERDQVLRAVKTADYYRLPLAIWMIQ